MEQKEKCRRVKFSYFSPWLSEMWNYLKGIDCHWQREEQRRLCWLRTVIEYIEGEVKRGLKISEAVARPRRERLIHWSQVHLSWPAWSSTPSSWFLSSNWDSKVFDWFLLYINFMILLSSWFLSPNWDSKVFDWFLLYIFCMYFFHDSYRQIEIVKFLIDYCITISWFSSINFLFNSSSLNDRQIK